MEETAKRKKRQYKGRKGRGKGNGQREARMEKEAQRMEEAGKRLWKRRRKG